MMRTKVAALVALASVLMASKPCPQAFELNEGATAPCTGVLFPERVAVECVQLKVSVLPRLELQLRHEKDASRLELQKAEALAGAYRTEADKLRELLKQRQPAVEPLPAWGIATIGAAVGAVIVGAVWLVVELR